MTLRVEVDHGYPVGTVNWLCAELMRLIVDNKGDLPVSLCIMRNTDDRVLIDIATRLRYIEPPDPDFPTVTLSG